MGEGSLRTVEIVLRLAGDEQQLQIIMYFDIDGVAYGVFRASFPSLSRQRQFRVPKFDGRCKPLWILMLHVSC